MYEQGLLNTGATLAARYLGNPATSWWVTNILVHGLPTVFNKFVVVNAWSAPMFPLPRLGEHFPYGLFVTPPTPTGP